VKDGDNFEARTAESVGDHELSARNHEFSGARDSSGAAEIRQLGQPIDGREERRGGAARRPGVVARDVLPKGS
jgi:hypothetical protein